jgi:4-diphosphocytidyl-2-C-methyl-D-erythritol kinase
VPSFVAFAPAKINLFLAITERRTDHFHNLVSVVAPLRFGDTLWFDLDDRAPAEAASIRLSCAEPSVPVDDSNLILKAAKAFIAETAWKGSGSFTLIKRIPVGAGLGGGSSDATATLRILNTAAGHPLASSDLARLAAQLGSDCPLFLAGNPLVMRGRGELLEALPKSATARISGRRVLVFKPWFGISTPWSYQTLAAEAPSSYLPPAAAEARIASWLQATDRPLEELLYNNMEVPAFRKFVSMPVLLQLLRENFGLSARMSGSGSACFALLPDTFDSRPAIDAIKAAWGHESLVIETSFT